MSVQVDAPVYIAERGSARDRETILSIWSGNLGPDALMRTKFDWFYRDCPLGEPLVVMLSHPASSTRIGVAAIGPRRMLWQSSEIKAGVLVDLAVSSEHRSLGPALMLERGLAKEGTEHFSLIYGFPNAKAVAVFKRIGCYEKLGDMVRYARVLRYADYAARRLPRAMAVPVGWLVSNARRAREALHLFGGRQLKTEWGKASDSRIDELWARSNKGDGLVGIRDSGFLRWRFEDSPKQARLLFVCDANKDVLLSWFACQGDGKTLHIRDSWTENAVIGVPRAHISMLLGAAYAAGYTSVSYEFCGPQSRHAGWDAAGFVERGRRPVYFSWGAGLQGQPIPENLHLTSADEDE